MQNLFGREERKEKFYPKTKNSAFTEFFQETKSEKKVFINTVLSFPFFITK